LSTLLTSPPGGMPDVDFLYAVQEIVRRQRMATQTPGLAALGAEVDRRLLAAVQLHDRLVLRLEGPTLQDFLVGSAAAPQRVKLHSDGAHALAFAVQNPRRWVRLGPLHYRTRRAWHVTICRALQAIQRHDARVAELVSFAATRNGPGVRLRENQGQVLIHWCGAPGKSLAASN
jgi:hypothetical protein